MKINKSVIVLLSLVVALILFVAIRKFEGEKPVVEFALSSGAIGAVNMQTELTGEAKDTKSGIRKLVVELIKEGTSTLLLEKKFQKKGISEYRFAVGIEPKKLELKDGRAILKATVSDYSWRNSGRGSSTFSEKKIFIDTTPPEIEVISHMHNIRQGGSALVIYRLSEPCEKTGVIVGGNFFPGYTGAFEDEKIFVSFIGLAYNQPIDTEIFLESTDYAGNQARASFYTYLKKGKFKNDTINITDRFLRKKMPEFFQIKENSFIEQFLSVNRDMRKADFERIKSICENPEKKIYWEGAFLRFPNSAQRAGFGDKREYKYKNNIIDKQVHMGIDLASTKHSTVPAANNGKVLFADWLGIYGKTVIIDHGFGLFSLYAHLNRTDIKAGMVIAKGDVVGLSGSTGLAGGDHLHFSMIVNNLFVSPLEWWDENWIKNNIISKTEDMKNGENN